MFLTFYGLDYICLGPWNRILRMSKKQILFVVIFVIVCGLYLMWDWVKYGVAFESYGLLMPTETKNQLNFQVNFLNDSTSISPSELQAIAKGLEWPALPTLITATNQATSAKTSSYKLQNPLHSYRIGDVITVIITARNDLGQPKLYGGDFFQAKLYNNELKASVFAEVIDNYNGTYTVNFTLPWEGQAIVSIRLIHSSEAVEVLRRHRENEPDKVYFVGVYREGAREEKVVCNAQKSARLLSASPCCCEYKDGVTMEFWVCRKPSTLPCSAWVDHSFGGYQAELSSLESALLHRQKTDVVLDSSDVTVYVSHGNRVSRLATPVPAGFYLDDKWTSMLCHSKSFPKLNDITKCLRDKQILMMGDSTLRQWFEYLVQTIPTLKQLKLFTSEKSGPFEAVDLENNIRMIWRAHGIPLRTTLTPRTDLHYIASEIGTLAGGEHSVVVFTIWAHFTTFPLATYLHRLAGIRSAVQALLHRAPRTLVVIKSANTGYKDVYGSDWLSWQLECALRIMFKELPVVIIDVWQMTSCHYSPDQIHPPPVVIQNEVDLFLSFVCPV